MEKVNDPSMVQHDKTSGSGKRTTIVDEDDPCIKKDKIEEEASQTSPLRSPGNDPRYTHKVNHQFRQYRVFNPLVDFNSKIRH